MDEPSASAGVGAPKDRDWDLLYRESTPPWETGEPTDELVRLVEEKVLKPCTVLELGCGTGANAIYLAKRGFEVTAVDMSPTAIERARTRCEQSGALLRIVLDDVFSFVKNSGSFDLVFDCGFYHFIRQIDLSQFLDLLWRVTYPGSLYLTLSGAAGETAPDGPPQVSEEQMRRELGRLFECVVVRPFRFASLVRSEGFLAWSCLMRRPTAGQSAGSP
jgi:SAM-dependent methyltransferase